MSPSAIRFLLILIAAALCGEARSAALTVRVTDEGAAPVADAAVYAIPTTPIANARPPAPAEIEQVKLAFQPLVTIVQTGGAVSFPNRDTVRHQVYSFSPAKIFELRLYAGLPSTPQVFDKPGLVVLGCNIHDRMVAYVLVVDTPWFGKTAANGQVRLDGLPAGDYKVSVWNPKMTGAGAPKTVHVASDTSLDATIDARPTP